MWQLYTYTANESTEDFLGAQEYNMLVAGATRYC